MTQRELVLKYIQDFGSITPLEAFRDLGVTRLSAVIFTLRKRGNLIVTDTETATNRYGKTVKYARYRLMGYEEVTEYLDQLLEVSV